MIKIVLEDTTLLIHCEAICQLQAGRYRAGDRLGFADLDAGYLVEYDREKYGGSFAIESVEKQVVDGEAVPVLHLKRVDR